MSTMTEKGTLQFGIEFDGKVHKDFELRAQFVGDAVEVMEIEKAQRNNSYYSLCVIARLLISLGTIPKQAITADLLMNLFDEDLLTLTEAAERTRQRVRDFRGGGKAPEKKHPGDAQTGV